jgi:type IV secretory pathway protease TraF
MQTTRAKIAIVMLACCALFAAGVQALMTSTGAWNNFDSLALAWYLVLVLAPLIGVYCFVLICRTQAGSRRWAWLGLLLIPQLYIWFLFVRELFHYWT